MRTILLLTAIIFTSLELTISQEPTKWRGPEANGIFPAKEEIKDWTAQGPIVLWSYDELGKGYSSPAIANGNIYLTGMEEKTGFIYVLSIDGKFQYKFAYGNEFDESYPGSRSTPTIVGNLAYILSGYGILACFDLETQKMKWMKKLLSDFDGENIRWGVTETIVVDGDKLYCTPGGKNNNVLALNRLSGELIWSCAGKSELSAYCTPLMIDLPSRKLLVTHTGSHILGIDRQNGQLLWSHEQPNQWSVHANTPVYSNGSLYYISGYGRGSGRLDISEDGSKVTPVWFNQQHDNRMGGAVVIDNYVYASGDKYRKLFCLDFKTGKEMWNSGETGIGVTIASNGMLICYSDKGELSLVKASPDSFQIKGKTKVTLGSEQHWSHPVIYEGILYLRHGKSLIAYKL